MAAQQQQQVRALIGSIAENCFKVCIDGKPGTRLSSSEQSCMVSRAAPYCAVRKIVSV
jgi:hypothetical protein